MPPANTFPELTLTGDSRKRGLAHGEQLRGEIARTIDFYRQLFALSEQQLKEQALFYAGLIGEFSADYASEIESIARGADVQPWLIYALNSRSEILNNCSVPECTAAINTRKSLLCQNWDWSQALEDLVVLLRIERNDGHRIATLTEPGILAKVGLNSCGIGVCLNILQANTRLRGLPIHLLLRAILDCKDISSVRGLVDANRVGKASHILVGNAVGDCLSVEFSGPVRHILCADDGLLWHSNHYLAHDDLNSSEAFPSTRERYARAGRLLSEDASINGLWQMMSDHSEGELSICRSYSPSATPGFGNVGTIFSVLMELQQGTLRIRRGDSPDRSDYTIKI